MCSEWERCVAFHGHQCGGLMIGYKAALRARELLSLGFSRDEEVVCVAENDACGVDAIQVMLGCSVGKGNLLFRLRGKQAFSFFRRADGTAVRLVLRSVAQGLGPEQSLAFYARQEPSDLFAVTEVPVSLPPAACRHASMVCQQCGEITAEHMLCLRQGRTLCMDCAGMWNRFAL